MAVFPKETWAGTRCHQRLKRNRMNTCAWSIWTRRAWTPCPTATARPSRSRSGRADATSPGRPSSAWRRRRPCVRDGKVFLTDGPFAETKEPGRLLPDRRQGPRRRHPGGRKDPPARVGSIEVRPSESCRQHNGSRTLPPAPAAISISGLTKTYASGLQALKRVDLEIRQGEIFALLGPNGAGKTTLMSIVCGIVTPTTGRVLVDGHDIVSSTAPRGRRSVWCRRTAH